MSVVIPALNEENNLPLVLEGLPPVDEVIVVDGGSLDDTAAVAREVRPDAVVIRQTRTGKGNALACGFAACTGDIVVTLNADGSTDPGELPRYVDALLAGAEVAHGSRYRDGGGNMAEGRWDRVGHRLLNWLVNLLFGTRFTDLGHGYNAYWRVLLPVLDLPAPRLPGLRRGEPVWGDGPEIEPLINIRMAAQGLRVVEIASVGYPRIHGRRERRVAAECLRALKTLLAEYLRRWRIVHEASRASGAHSARHGAAASGGRTTRQYAALRRVRPEASAAPPQRKAGVSPAAVDPDAGRHSTNAERDNGSAERRQGARPQRAIDRGRHAGWSADLRSDPSADWSPDTAADWRSDPRAGWSSLVQPSTDRAPSGPTRSRPDLTVITGGGGTEQPTGRRTRPPARSTHLRAVAGERYRRPDAERWDAEGWEAEGWNAEG